MSGSLAEGVAVRATYKFYASGVIAPNALDDITTAPGAAGGQVLRRVSLTPAMKRASYTSAEIRTDRQVANFRLGTKSVAGTISGELSPGTYFDFWEASHRDTRVGFIRFLTSRKAARIHAITGRVKLRARPNPPVRTALEFTCG